MTLKLVHVSKRGPGWLWWVQGLPLVPHSQVCWALCTILLYLYQYQSCNNKPEDLSWRKSPWALYVLLTGSCHSLKNNTLSIHTYSDTDQIRCEHISYQLTVTNVYNVLSYHPVIIFGLSLSYLTQVISEGGLVVVILWSNHIDKCPGDYHTCLCVWSRCSHNSKETAPKS